MNLLNRLTIKNLKLNKRRTIVTIIGIMLSVALITVVATIYSSGIKSLILYEKRIQGNFHAAFYDVPSEEVSSIKNNRGVDDVFLTKKLGYAELKDSKNKDKPYAYILGLNKESMENLSIRLVDGRFPTNESEILISTHLKTNGRIDLKVGDNVTLDVGKRVSDDYELEQHNPYNEDEKIVETNTKTYTIVGIIERPAYNVEPYSAPGYTFITYLNENNISGKVNVYTKYNKDGSKNYLKVTANILGVDENIFTKYYSGEDIKEDELQKVNDELSKAKYKIDMNGYLIELENNPISNNQVNGLIYVVVIICVIIVFTSIFCIKNSFDISITEKVKQYGMLRSIGATKKQIRKNVFYEATILAVIGIPLGLLLGFIASYLLIIISNLLIKDMFASGLKLVLSYSFVSYLIAIILGIITIYLSSFRSAIKASKVNPIDSIRNSANIKINSKKLKTPKIISKLFGIGGQISYKNLKRNKKKYRSTILSLTVSVLLFISLTYFIGTFMKVIKDEVSISEYNISYSINVVDEETLDKVYKTTKLDNIKDYTILRLKYININNPKVSKELDDYYSEYVSIGLVSLGSEQYIKYLKSLGLNYDEYKDKGILVDTIKYGSVDENNKRVSKTAREFDYKIGDTISLNNTLDKTKDINSYIGYITDKRPFGLINNTNQSYLIVSDEYYEANIKDNNNNRYSLYFDSSNANKLQDDIDLVLGSSEYSLYNKEENMKVMKNMVFLIGIFLYGFIIVVTLIGVTNVFNTITTSMELRKQEFAILKSIGMTSREFNRMIRLESIFMCIKSLIYGISIGLLLSYLIYYVFGFNNGIKFELPVSGILISSLFVFILISILMKYSINKINKQNTIETIRNENI